MLLAAHWLPGLQGLPSDPGLPTTRAPQNTLLSNEPFRFLLHIVSHSQQTRSHDIWLWWDPANDAVKAKKVANSTAVSPELAGQPCGTVWCQGRHPEPGPTRDPCAAPVLCDLDYNTSNTSVPQSYRVNLPLYKKKKSQNLCIVFFIMNIFHRSLKAPVLLKKEKKVSNCVSHILFKKIFPK